MASTPGRQWVLAGIILLPLGCFEPGCSPIHTRVSAFLAWIQSMNVTGTSTANTISTTPTTRNTPVTTEATPASTAIAASPIVIWMVMLPLIIPSLWLRDHHRATPSSLTVSSSASLWCNAPFSTPDTHHSTHRSKRCLGTVRHAWWMEMTYRPQLSIPRSNVLAERNWRSWWDLEISSLMRNTHGQVAIKKEMEWYWCVRRNAISFQFASHLLRILAFSLANIEGPILTTRIWLLMKKEEREICLIHLFHILQSCDKELALALHSNNWNTTDQIRQHGKVETGFSLVTDWPSECIVQPQDVNRSNSSSH